MNDTVKEWISKAELDYATAERELQAVDKPNFDGICFHAQQCIEKLMKGFLIHRGILPPKSHDLVYLSELLTPVCPEWSWPIQDLRFLSRAAVDFRYPGEEADYDEAERAVEIAAKVKEKLQKLIIS